MSHARNVSPRSNRLMAFAVLKGLVKANPLLCPLNNEELQHEADYVFDVLPGVYRVRVVQNFKTSEQESIKTYLSLI